MSDPARSTGANVPRIAGVRLTAVAVPYRPELGTVVTTGLALSEARHVLVEVRAEDGATGLGEAVPRPSVYGETLDGIRAAIEGLLAPPLLGLAVTDTERAWAAWDRVVGNQSAKAALDVALHDLVGRIAGLPLHRLLGGWAGETIPLTMALGLGQPDTIADGAARAIAAGYRSVKVKVGKDVATDVRAVAAVREAIGPDVLLYVDANGGYSRADALRAARAFERYAVALLEEPLPAWDRAGRAWLAGRTDIGLLLDESTNELGRVPAELATGAPAAISIRAARSGISLTRHLVGLAVAHGIECLVGSHRELGVGVVTNAHLAAGFRAMAYPAELGSHVFIEDGLLRRPVEIGGGTLRLPDGPGLGVDLDPERVARYRVWTATVGDWPA